MPNDTCRKRTSIACEQCRKGKRKCDWARPVCSECRAHGRQCVFRAERTRPRQKVWDKEYVKSLEEQVAALTAAVQDLRSSSSSTLPPVSVPATDIPDHIPSSILQKTQNVEATEDLAAMTWKVALDSSGSPSIIGPSGFFSFFANSPQFHTEETDSGSQLAFELSNLWKYARNQELLDELATNFLDYINPYYQFINRGAFHRPVPYAGGTIDLQIFYSAAYALGACYSKRKEARDIGAAFSQHAGQLVFDCYRTRPDHNLVRSLAMLALRELSMGNNSVGWMHLSLAAGLVVQLGIPAIGSRAIVVAGPDGQAVEAGIEAFWSFYFVDRLAVAILGRTSLDSRHRLHIPAFENAFSSDSMTEEQRIFDKISQLWNIHDHHMDKMVTVTFRALTTQEQDWILMEARGAILEFYNANCQLLKYANGAVVSSGILVLQMCYHVSVVAIHRPFLSNTSGSSSSLALQTMISSAASISKVIRLYRRTSDFTKAPPFVVYHLLRAALAHLLAASAAEKTSGKKPLTDLAICLDALEEMSKCWPTRVSQVINLIRELACRWKVTWALPMHLSNTPAHLTNGSVKTHPTNDQPYQRHRIDVLANDEPSDTWNTYGWGDGTGGFLSELGLYDAALVGHEV
ncbi:hypothetical protein B0J13DRAFT_158677 [Dactylonectria estremocensis]|uniref:Zn(2)-C6 fungal-type domain-containing protein n=1 Tax=Dactylonectria estremocensis TaxID=1079267 RepID=A0A9P9IIV8_9HYPO|nr:hypothetical protein B0J13DRAFT_158677 [Dactylonectria estremocensis]